MINRETHFDCNDAVGAKAEKAVSEYLSRNCTVLDKENEWDADVTLDLGVYGKVGVGVECIKRWQKVGEYEYLHYNLLTHKRARKMLNRHEVFLFVVSLDCSQFMLLCPSDVPRDARHWCPRGKLSASDGSSFERGDGCDPLVLAGCPWGFNGRETAFCVPAKPVHRFDSAIDFPYNKAMRKIGWTGPDPIDQVNPKR